MQPEESIPNHDRSRDTGQGIAPGEAPVIIVGAGIVGVSTAIWLQRYGVNTVLIDRHGPATGTSYGNAGVLASCAVVPVTVPGLIRKAPGMLFSRNQPLFLKWRYLPTLLPWLRKYLSHCNIADVSRIADALVPIVGNSLADHQSLAAGTQAEKWIVPGPYIFGYRDRAHFRADALGWQIRNTHGFEGQEMDAKQFQEFDPIFGGNIGYAVSVKQHGRILDPGRYVEDLAAHFEHNGGKILTGEVEDVVQENGHVTGVRASGELIAAKAVVITTGVWSKPLVKKLGFDVPLESERGYHLELYEPSVMPRAPTMIAAGKFVATPMQGRLRLAGMIEFGGLKTPVTEAAVDLLERNIRKIIPGLTWTESKKWLGHRPAPADSIPIIGEAKSENRGVKGAYIGFGHHHVGLTGGPRTGQLLAQLISGKTTDIELAKYSPARFQ